MTSNLNIFQSFFSKIVLTKYKRRLFFLLALTIFPIILASITRSILISYIVSAALILVIVYFKNLHLFSRDEYSNSGVTQYYLRYGKFMFSNKNFNRYSTNIKFEAEQYEKLTIILEKLRYQFELQNFEFESKMKDFDKLLSKKNVAQLEQSKIETILSEIKHLLASMTESVDVSKNNDFAQKIIKLKTLVTSLEEEIELNLFHNSNK